MIGQNAIWHISVPGKRPQPGEIHVWRLLLPPPGFLPDRIRESLSADEWTRASAFHFEKDRYQYLMARGVLRELLAAYQGRQPRDLVIGYTHFGKPVLEPERGFPTIHFNVSHSGGMVLYAFASDRLVGIDIEKIRSGLETVPIARNFFSENEIRSLNVFPEKERTEIFFRYWTRKEALIKAMGKSMALLQKRFDVSVMDGVGTVAVLPEINAGDSGWQIRDLMPGEGYAAAICAEGDLPDISYWQYQY